jgi:hypothetical protein
VSFSHKAFAFDWVAFEGDLAPILQRALETDDPSAIEAFIEEHRLVLRDPYEGEALSPDWRDLLEVGDLQELSDFALTRYYNPAEDVGLAEAWSELHEAVEAREKASLLGTPFSSFDPGRMGSYFQTPAQTESSFSVLRERANPRTSEFVEALRKVVSAGKGLYVTF